MKKLLLVALVAFAGFNMVEARRGCSTNRCETSCEPKCEVKKACCIPAPRVVDCVSSVCEGEKPDLCGVIPAPRNVIKHVDTQITYTCAPLEGCAVPATEEQVEMFRQNGSVRPTTCCR
jgi:hypothetical protein